LIVKECCLVNNISAAANSFNCPCRRISTRSVSRYFYNSEPLFSQLI